MSYTLYWLEHLYCAKAFEIQADDWAVTCAACSHPADLAYLNLYATVQSGTALRDTIHAVDITRTARTFALGLR
jgi:hypothetical protein